ncbi:MAG: class I SAM-dependent methyltransferase [Alphaproteobacteria bacterium]
MSRLDSFIRRLEAQRACIDRAVELTAALPGFAIEVGLGNGRTYDHLRDRAKGREIFAFDRQVAAHPACVPDAAHLMLGDFRVTLAQAASVLGGKVAICHADIGSGDEAASQALGAEIAPLIDALMAPGGVVVGDQVMRASRWEELPLPPGVEPGRYFIRRVR